MNRPWSSSEWKCPGRRRRRRKPWSLPGHDNQRARPCKRRGREKRRVERPRAGRSSDRRWRRPSRREPALRHEHPSGGLQDFARRAERPSGARHPPSSRKVSSRRAWTVDVRRGRQAAITSRGRQPGCVSLRPARNGASGRAMASTIPGSPAPEPRSHTRPEAGRSGSRSEAVEDDGAPAGGAHLMPATMPDRDQPVHRGAPRTARAGRSCRSSRWTPDRERRDPNPHVSRETSPSVSTSRIRPLPACGRGACRGVRPRSGRDG